MTNTGIVRKIDQLGRLVIPSELRKEFEINEGTPMEMYTEDGDIIIRKYVKKCTFCGQSDINEITTYRGKAVCFSCMNDISRP